MNQNRIGPTSLHINALVVIISGTTTSLLGLRRFPQFPDPIHSWFDSLDGGSARCKARKTQAQIKLEPTT
jgi:hypothetical protein